MENNKNILHRVKSFQAVTLGVRIFDGVMSRLIDDRRCRLIDDPATSSGDLFSTSSQYTGSGGLRPGVNTLLLSSISSVLAAFPGDLDFLDFPTDDRLFGMLASAKV